MPAEAARRVGIAATRGETLYEEGVDQVGVAMRGPEGNESDIHRAL